MTCDSEHVKQVQTVVLTLRYDYHYEHVFRGQRKNKLLFWAPALRFTKLHCAFPLSKGCRTHSECSSRCTVIQWLRPRSQLQKSDRASPIIHHRNAQDRLPYFQVCLFFPSTPLLALHVSGVLLKKRQHLKLGTASLAAACSFLSIPVAMMTGSTDGYRRHPQQCQRSFTVCLFCFFCLEKDLKTELCKRCNFCLFCIAEFLNFLLSWLNLGFFINLTHTHLWHILQMTLWEKANKTSENGRPQLGLWPVWLLHYQRSQLLSVWCFILVQWVTLAPRHRSIARLDAEFTCPSRSGVEKSLSSRSLLLFTWGNAFHFWLFYISSSFCCCHPQNPAGSCRLFILKGRWLVRSYFNRLQTILPLYSAMPLLCKVRISFCTAPASSNTDDLWNILSKTTRKFELNFLTSYLPTSLTCLDLSSRNSTTCVSRVNTPGLLVGGKILGNLWKATADWLPTLFCFNGKEKKKTPNKLAKDWGHTNAHTCIQMNGEEFKLMRWHTKTRTRPVSHPNTCVQGLAHKLIGHPISNLLSLSL